MNRQEIKELKTQVEGLRKVEPSDERVRELRERNEGNSDDTFDEGIELGEIYGANTLIDSVLAILDAKTIALN